MRDPGKAHVTGLVALTFEAANTGILDAVQKRAAFYNRLMIANNCTRASLFEELFASVTRLLDPETSADASYMIGQAHVLIIAEQHALDVDASLAICSALGAARDRFRSRMGRAILAVRGRFEPFGQATEGFIQSLPLAALHWRDANIDAFDMILLLDQVRTDGTSSTSAGGIDGGHAQVLASLMLSDFEESIYRVLSHQRGRLGFGGLFISCGVAVLPFSTEAIVQSIATTLWNRMVRQVLHESQNGNPSEIIGDSWAEQAEIRLLSGPREEADPPSAEAFYREAIDDLQRGFDCSQYHPGALLRLLVNRENSLAQIRDRAKARLASFMDEFAPWYVRSKFARNEPLPPPPPIEHHEYDYMRILTLIICIAGIIALLLGHAAMDSSPLSFPSWLILVLLAGIATVMLILGLTRTVLEEQARLPTPPQRDMIKELKQRRALIDTAARVAERHAQLARAIQEDIEGLKTALSEASPGINSSGTLVPPDDLIDQLLVANNLDVRQALRGFWEQPQERLLTRATTPEGLAQRLKAYAHERCSVFAKLQMNDILSYLGGAAAVDSPLISREIDRLQLESSPWMPVRGMAWGIIIAVPEGLSQSIRDSITERFQQPLLLASTKREGIVVLQWTQGYAEAGAQTIARMTAL